MNIAQPTGQAQNIQLPGYVKNVTEYVGNTAQSIGQGYNEMKSNVNTSLNTFSQQATAGVGASQQFLTSNTIVAKFAFVIFVIIMFVILLGLGINIIGYFTDPSNSPYLIKGMISGNDSQVISQNPIQKSAVTLLRSNNQKYGLEFTWSVWLYITDINNSTTKFQHVFNKGENNYDQTTGIATLNNGPGLYIGPGNGTTQNSLRIVMNTTGPVNPPSDAVIDIPNIPLKKWINIVIRMENTMLDVYVNGVIAERQVLDYVPKQNYSNVMVCQNSGFSGNLSNLRYFDRALNVIEINNIVMWGPNTSASKSTNTTKGGFKYLSQSWYTGFGI